AYTVTKPQTTQTVSKIAQVKPNNTGIRASVYEKTAKNGAKYADRTFYVTKERAHGNEYNLVPGFTVYVCITFTGDFALL
ncbi:hypothetical protein APW75_06585, partial [Staphylococcus aureus]|uniref:hypothetical protein n=1 Tax=Staphylococcus aureus TaxID=1280 RepID=UPI000BD002C5